MNIDPQIQNPIEHDDSCPVWDDMVERVEKMVELQRRLRECAEDLAINHLDDSYTGNIEDMIYSHVDEAGDDISSIINELHAEYLNLRR